MNKILFLTRTNGAIKKSLQQLVHIHNNPARWGLLVVHIGVQANNGNQPIGA